MTIEEHIARVEKRLRDAGVLGPEDGSVTERYHDMLRLEERVNDEVPQALAKMARRLEVGDDMDHLEKRIQKALRKALSAVGTEYTPDPERFQENPNSYPGAWESQGGKPDNLLAHLNSGGVKSTVPLQLTKDIALRQLGVKVRTGARSKSAPAVNLHERDVQALLKRY